MKKIKHSLIFVILGVLFAGYPLQGQDVQTEQARLTAWQNFKAEQGPSWLIRWSEETGVPRSIHNGKTQTYRGTPEEAARTFLSEHRELFAMQSGLKDLQHLKTTENKHGLRRVTFHQHYKGIPVEEAEYKVQLFEDGRVGMANGFYYPDIDVSITPSLSSERAIEIAKQDLELTNPSGESNTTELVVFPKKEKEGTYALAWKTIVFAEQPFIDWLYYVDAQSGDILEKQNRLMDVTGSGKVYPTHPGLSSVTTKDLYRLNGTGYLEGTYVKVENDDGAEAYSANHAFEYSTSSTHFDEANLYYHVDDFRHNFIEGLGNLGFTQITAHAHASHWLYGDLNAWFSKSTEEIYFGDAASSSTYNNFAREDKVIHHEYGHAVIHDKQSGIYSNSTEEGAISEGTPDYFAGAYTGRSVTGDYVAPQVYEIWQIPILNPTFNISQNHLELMKVANSFQLSCGIYVDDQVLAVRKLIF